MWLVALALVAGTTGCPPRPQTFAPKSERRAGLPETVEELVELADRIHAERPVDPHRADRALAALELARDKGAAEPYEVLWRLSRAGFVMVELLGPSLGKKYAEAGRAYGLEALGHEEARVEGHYYLALSTAKVAEATSDVDMLEPMMAIARRAADLDPAFDDAGPLRLMGKTYLVAPEWPTSVGDRDEAVEVLKRAVSLAPTPLNRLFLGEAFYHAEEFDKAEAQLRRALKDGRGGALAERWIDEAGDYLRRMGVAH